MTPVSTLWRGLVLVLAGALLAACSSAPSRGGYYQDDGPHRNPPVDLSRITDAVPKNEPLSARGNSPYDVFHKTYYPLKQVDGYRERGIASWYGKKFHGRHTSNGETYDMYAMTAAHKTLPLPSYVRVRNLTNGRSVIVRVNDRGPFLENRLIDLSYAAAYKLNIIGTGTGIVEVTAVTTDDAEPARAVAQAPVAPAAMATSADAVAVAPALTPVTDSPPRLYLQVGAFVSRDNAESLRRQLEQAEFGSVEVQTATQQETTLYRVRIGPLPNVDASDRLAQRVVGYGIRNAFVTVE